MRIALALLVLIFALDMTLALVTTDIPPAPVEVSRPSMPRRR